MTERAPTAVVVIGRNEGDRLVRCLRSLSAFDGPVVYVDSASSDGSVERARALGLIVHELDPSRPLSAARARNEGVDRLLREHPGIELVQFVDGDCVLANDWLEAAASHMAEVPSISALCGRLTETHRDASIYNRLCDMEWNVPPGEARHCGGIFMCRVGAFREAGGFDETLIAGEEPDLCSRLRAHGGRIVRIDRPMATHDAAMTRFGQWWRRAARGGYAAAEGAWLHTRNGNRGDIRRCASTLLWAVMLPVTILSMLWPTGGFSLLALLLYPLQWWRIRRGQLISGGSKADASLYATFTLLSKAPQAVGMARFGYRLLTRQRIRAMEPRRVSRTMAPRPVARSTVIVYVAARIPSLSETFVYREILGLRRMGRTVLPANLFAPNDEFHDPELQSLARDGIRLYGGGWARLVRDCAVEVVTRPISSTQTIATAAADALGTRGFSVRGRAKLMVQCVASLAAARRLRDAEPSWVHAHMANTPATIAMYLSRQLGIPFSFTGHANDIFVHGTVLREKLERSAFAACISHWHREHYRGIALLSNDHLPVIRCGVDTGVFEMDSRPRSRHRVVAVGRLVEKKGFATLVQATAMLVRDGVDQVQVLIAGDGPERSALASLIQRLGLEQHVQLLGAMQNEEIRELVAGAELFALPCVRARDGDVDGIPVALMESMSLGTAVIAGDLPAIRELVIDGETGLVVAPGDTAGLARAIRDLLEDDALRERLRVAGRRWIEEEFCARRNLRRLADRFDGVGAS